MPGKPQRPFVPHHTPTSARPPVIAPEFRLYRPFLPGSERGAVESVAFVGAGGVVQEQGELGGSLRPIADFLDTPTRGRDPGENAAGDFYASDTEEGPDELPPVEHFLDPLPPVNDFAPAAGRNLSNAWPEAGADLGAMGAPVPGRSEPGWGETDWQQYDWRGAAALGETSGDDATTAWAATDWDGTGHRGRAREPRESAAHAIASALDEIARRIREGDLSSSGPGPLTDPATIAATLAALLGVRR